MKQQESVTTNPIRNGNPSSSNAFLFDQNGKTTELSVACLKYLDQKRAERILGATSEIEFYSKQTAWGDFCEMYVFHEMLGLEYKYIAQDTQEHHSIKGWVGTPDYIKELEKVVADCKAFYPANFLNYVEVLTQGIDSFKKEYKKEYWQLVSNACIKGWKTIEPIAFLPKKSRLAHMGEFAENIDSVEQFKYKFISDDGLYGDYTLPHMADHSNVKELNIFQFEVPDEDIERLTNRMKLGLKILNEKK